MDTERKRRVIVFFTSNERHASEWENRDEGWGFSLSYLYAWRADGSGVSQVGRRDDIKFPQEFERLVVWVNGKKLREEVEGQNPATRDDRKLAVLLDDHAQQVFSGIKAKVGEAHILVAWHRWARLSITGAMLVEYHTLLSGFKPILLKLVEAKDFAIRFDEAWKYLLSAPRLPALKHLSHRIEHIFAPLAIDIQGILQVEPFRRLEYARKIIESSRTRGENPFLKLLADLYYLLCEKEQLTSQSVTVETNLGKEDLPEVRTLDGSYGRMPLSELLGSQSDIPPATRIREICGLADWWTPRADSWLANFLRDLDEAVTGDNPGELVELIMSKGKKFLQICRELHRCFDELEQLLPEYAKEPPEEAP
jgi:hypothetical protein